MNDQINDILKTYGLGLITRNEAVNQIGNLIVDEWLKTPLQ